MDCDNREYWYENAPCLVSFILFKKNDLIMKFVDEWLFFAQDERALTDIPNQLGKPNLPEFKAHRHDQSIYSILVKKYGFKRFADISQFGNPWRKDMPQIIEHTREWR
jgi:hypothetical protein